MRLLVLSLLLSSLLPAADTSDAAGPPAEFSGKVLDAWTRQPVSLALIEIPSDNTAISADSLGRFAFRRPDETPVSLTISRAGYAQRTWPDLKPGPRLELVLFPARYRLEGITITALRTPVPLGQGPSTVVKPAEAGAGIELADLIRLSPTAERRDYANFSTVGLRGAASEHTLIELDGVRLNSAQSGTFDLSTLSPLLAERIEVARGGASAAHGSSAIGGVVNVITPEPDTLRGAIRAGLGSFGRRHLDVAHSLGVGSLGYFVAGQLLSSRNDFFWLDSLGSLRTLENADFSRRAAAAKVALRSGPVRASLLADLAQTERGVPGSTRWPSDSARRADDRGRLIAACDLQGSEQLRTEARLSAAAAEQRYRDPAFATDDTHRLCDFGARLDQSWWPWSWLLIRAGAEWAHEGLQSTALGRPARQTLAGWVQWRINRHGFDVSHVLRYELLRPQVRLRDTSDAAGPPADSTRASSLLPVFSPKVTLNWSGLGFVNLYTGFSRSFRAPTFNDLYWPEDPFTYGNPDLRPETGTTIDAGLGGTQPAWLQWWLGAYHTLLADLIEWQPDSLWRFHPVNVTRAAVSGIELDVRAGFGFAGVSIAGNFCSARAESLALIYRPRFSGRVSAWVEDSTPAHRPRLHCAVEYTGARFADAGNTDRLPAHALVNAGIALAPRLGRLGARAETGLRNLLDVRFETARAYPNPGRNWYLELGLGI